jgi:hypothetical protein
MTTPARHASIDEWPVVPETEAPRSHGPVRTDIGGAASGIVLGKATTAPAQPEGKSGREISARIIGWNVVPGYKIRGDPRIPIAKTEFGNTVFREALACGKLSDHRFFWVYIGMPPMACAISIGAQQRLTRSPLIAHARQP